MTANTFQQVFSEAMNTAKSFRSPDPPFKRIGAENNKSDTNSLVAYRGLMASMPDFSKTPSKPLRSTNYGKKPTRIPVSAQSRKQASPRLVTPQERDLKLYARIRPLVTGEKSMDIDISDTKICVRQGSRERSATFCRVLGEAAQQYEVFRTVAMPMLKQFLNGVDALLFTCGATGSGKTFTAQGTREEPGLIPRIVNVLLSQPAPKQTERGILVSCVDVFEEKILDLFGDENKPLRIGKDGFGFTSVKGVKEFEIKTEADVTRTMRDIAAARKKFSTRENTHCVFTLKLVTIPLDPRTGKRTTNLGEITCTRMSIVDLAGSDVGDPSIFVLGRCIRAVRKTTESEIPCDESKLTRMFQDYFEPSGRKTTTSVVVTMSASAASFDDTEFSLQLFATDAVDCSRKEEDDDEDFVIHTIDLDSDDGSKDVVDTQRLAQIEARIRQHVHDEMADKLRRMQDDYQQQVEQVRVQSTQPYTSKLQQALAQKMQRDTRARELQECIRERDAERAEVAQLEAQIRDCQNELSATLTKLEAAVSKNKMLETNIAKMIEGTKALHERYVNLKAQIEKNTAEKEAFWQRRVQMLEMEIARLRK